MNDAKQLEFLERIYEQLPKLPSHYCGSDSRKLYFEVSLKKTYIYNHKRKVQETRNRAITFSLHKI